jgi:hypothetical protein
MYEARCLGASARALYEDSPVNPCAPRGEVGTAAEQLWQEAGAAVVRAPASTSTQR